MARVMLTTPLAKISGIAPRFLKYLEKLNIFTVRDLLWHFPARYEDFSQVYKIADLEPGQQTTIQGTIQDLNIHRSWRKRMVVIEAIIADNSGEIKAVWFNQPYLVNVLRVGREGNFAGKVAVSDHELILSHPVYEFTGNAETKHTGRLVPIYPETRGLTSKGFRFLIQPILQHVEKLKEWMPKEALTDEHLPEINEALGAIHFPNEQDDAMRARKRFSFEELFLLQVFNLKQKLKLAEEKAAPFTINLENIKTILGELPFELTFSQKRSLLEIIKDLEKSTPMNRLLQGDVGSGKTVVAALATFLAAENNMQSAFMAPTEVLARQHFNTFKKILAGVKAIHQPIVGLLTASEAKIIYETDLEASVKKQELQKKIADGEIDIVIGTHALISNTDKASKQSALAFRNLGLVIVDEQHRFGVKQRSALLGANVGLIPHFLSMSATPIPRTLMLTVFGDLDISTITELPAGRKNIETRIVDPDKRTEAYTFIRSEVKKGRQAFVICPRIEPGTDEQREAAEKDKRKLALLDVKSVKEEFEKLSEKVFPDLRVEMLHGQLKAKEKEEIMNKFHDGVIDVLVSTSVIEVGVDVPNASIMMIEGSERFGLAQLYQFRGRVGRGEHQSYCFLFTDSTGESTKERLEAILKAKNGFELAEMDLAIRGPGEFLGESQAGMPDIAMNALQNMELVKSSRDTAQKIISKDPNLKSYPLLREKLAEFKKKIHLE